MNNLLINIEEIKTYKLTPSQRFCDAAQIVIGGLVGMCESFPSCLDCPFKPLSEPNSDKMSNIAQCQIQQAVNALKFITA